MWSNISTSSSSSPRQGTTRDESSSTIAESRLSGNKNDCEQSVSPLMRYKHAVCSAQSSGYIYIHGGRFGNLPLDDDVWRFDPHQNNWLQLQTNGSKPPSLQEHTLVEYNDQLYLFGGQISAPSTGISFWCLNLISNEWRSLSMKSSRYGAYLGPTNRRAHTAIVYANSMYIYGGFEDFRGSSGQLWEYDLINERWELRNLNATSSCHPEPRHNHSAIVYNDSMYIYGGLSNLKPLNDLWRWSWKERRWFRERTRGSSPGRLHGHSAIQAFDSMFVFGGERNGRATRGLWRLNLSNMTWQKIRPKGPRPNPITWHGAIANPLGILDEANYIIEGDPELLKDTSISISDNCMSMQYQHEEEGNRDDKLSLKLNNKFNHQLDHTNDVPAVLAHSKSSNADMISTKNVIGHDDRGKRKRSRLSFLRRSRNERPKSIYELKQMRTSMSATNFKNKQKGCHNINRHSVALIKTEPDRSKDINSSTIRDIGSNNCDQDTESNSKILDSLDTDIKRMFQDAFDPTTTDQTKSMEIDEIPASSLVEEQSGRSQYVTAIPVAGSQTFSSMNMRSQRTSYAYTTPPSEMNTLRDTEECSTDTRELIEQSRASRQALGLTSSMESGYNRRDNRPRSEIVQSLIDRADAGIKHLYTPYFNNNNNGGGVSNQQQTVDKLSFREENTIQVNGISGDESKQRSRRTRSFLDKSKRHTIHQTMTYYNLYFSEDKSSSSPPSDSTPGNGQDQTQRQSDDESMVAKKVNRDSSSGDTSKSLVANSTHAALIGVHGLPDVSHKSIDQQSLLSLDVNNNSSDSRTLCNESTIAPTIQSNNSNINHPSSAINTTNTNSTFQNALTALRDTSNESCDNTSLSFSVIAEFEEDDMLQQYAPSPIDSRTINGVEIDIDNQTRTINQMRGHNISNRVDTTLFREPEDHLQTMILTDQFSGSSQVHRLDGIEMQKSLAHKSSSSGYESISGPGEQNYTDRTRHDTPSQADGSQATHTRSNTSYREGMIREDSSMRTESSYSGETSSQDRSMIRNIKPNKVTNKEAVVIAKGTASSFETNDSLAGITSEPFEQSPSVNNRSIDHISCNNPSDSSGDNNNRQSTITKQQTNMQVLTQRKMPLISRSRFFSRSNSKSRYWQLCMLVIGGKQSGNSAVNEPITIWRLYI